MNEWVVSTLVTIGGIALIALVLWLKENHQDILIGFFVAIIVILVLIGMINAVHEFIYDVLPSLRGIK